MADITKTRCKNKPKKSCSGLRRRPKFLSKTIAPRGCNAFAPGGCSATCGSVGMSIRLPRLNRFRLLSMITSKDFRLCIA
jgi:hypothetical protein